MNTFEQDLKEAVEYHGHICAGQIIGVRMARLGLKLLEIDNPKEYRDLIVFIETDRCLADAVGTVTNCKIGRRRLKVYDFGKMAATFYDMNSKRAVRIYKKYEKHADKGEDIKEFFKRVSDEELFSVEEVKIELKPWDLPGKPLVVKRCSKCQEEILDGRHLESEGKTLCKSCSGQIYYERI